MPIYEYRCEACGHQQEFLQKVSDPTLTVCPACGKSTFAKMLTAAGFQLKGSGWYATDFKNKGSSAAPAAKAEGKSEGGGEKPAAESKSESSSGGSSSGPACGSGGCAACS